ncbi:MAG TPA: glutamyl-tRNA amidotransferase, partial [Nitrospira sp.]|nr:glutamyl-tRNA amidotransferase [Nitrospira sp.]
VVAESGASSIKDMGQVMKTVMARLAGHSVDGKVVSELVKAALQR